MSKKLRIFFVTLGVFTFAASFLPAAHAGDDWQPINPEELKMTSEPAAPGAMAIYLFREVDRDDVIHHENTYARIKILNEEGRKSGLCRGSSLLAKTFGVPAANFCQRA